MNKIRKGDQVFILAGKDKGKRGTVLRMLLASEKLVVEGINVIKKHVKPNPATNSPGGIVEKEAPIHISNVALYNPITGKPDKVGIKTLEDGRKVRFYKSNQEVVDV